MMQLFSTSLFPLLVALAGIGDAFSYRIPNWLTALVAILFFPMAAITGLGGEAVLWHLATGLGVLTLGFALFAFGLFGGGDAKLLAAAALWLGWPCSLAFIVYTALAGGVLALVVLVYSACQIYGEIWDSNWIRKLASLQPNVPYGLAIAAGAILAFPQSWWMRALPL